MRIRPKLKDGADWSDADYMAYWRALCVITDKGCWEWQGYCHAFRNQKPGQKGYATGGYRGQTRRLNRVVLKIKLGRPLDPKEHGCHECDNPPCINPDHLYPGTNQQNHIDGSKRKRMQGQTKTHCKHGHEFTPDNIYWSPRKTVNGVIGRIRVCIACKRIRLRNAYRKDPQTFNERVKRSRLKAKLRALG